MALLASGWSDGQAISVAWGGNGTQGLQMALVKQNGFSRRVVSPVVVDAAPLPGRVINGLRDMHSGTEC